MEGLYMRIEARFVCSEIIGPLRNGDYELPEGAAISDLINLSRSECAEQVPDNRLDYLIFMLNGKPAKLDTCLADGDKVLVLRKIVGG